MSTETKITPEQEAILRDRIRQEILAEQAAAASRSESRNPDEFVYTCVKPNKRPVLYDLGTKAGKNFYPETFEPGEVKDLSENFRPREIRASRHLRDMVKKGILRQGRHEMDTALDPLTVRAIEAGDAEDTFKDPLSGQRSYDLRLAQEEAKIRKANGDVPR